eukprot:CAMPEP_0118985258 /NCGR_PEP_ID=MMETSP1173-20130426/39560_1 /TAXON_ID=1034831 /ORGANISM="Rhizochromulina marina cf, Strain CCMP1243" /LENGTH=36 /DNA_ID= /DNA_START= /DNA_END= /DNA_ORIENTATION=
MAKNDAMRANTAGGEQQRPATEPKLTARSMNVMPPM